MQHDESQLPVGTRVDFRCRKNMMKRPATIFLIALALTGMGYFEPAWAHSHHKSSKRKHVIRKKELHIGSLLSEDIQEKPTNPPRPLFSNLKPAKSDVGVDLGGDLPWPVPKNPLLFPGNREIGFHVGVRYKLDSRWDLTGLAGAAANQQIDPLKPNDEQIGIKARYRF